ncbi:MAG: hypothetical protein CME64_08620 [Halobacteriovoraceae bacterium]|nr:hypothetical protein [Halobacteriovoraceae bacterium]|tara:strand:+ start:262247 stop:262981 length:735 start_codon:yes stop_codon:yes gene_type:complete
MRIALILSLAIILSTYAQSPCSVWFLNSPTQIGLFLEKNVSWFSRIQELQLSDDFVKSLADLPQEVQGRVSAGIFRATTDEGDFVLKFLPGHIQIDQYAHKILMQKHLSEFGLSPKVKGVFFRKSIKDLKEKFPQIDPKTNVGILMENVDGVMIKQAFIEGGKLPGIGKLPLSPEFNEKVRANLHSLEKALNDLEVSIMDAQMIITKSGEVKLIDFDFYEWSPDEIMRENRREADFRNILDLFR